MVPVFVYIGTHCVDQWTEYETYFQCNWGYSGGGDGYFHAMGFNPQTGCAYNPENMPDCPWGVGAQLQKTNSNWSRKVTK